MHQSLYNFVRKNKISNYLGIAGVSPRETKAARLCWRIFISLMLIVGFFLLIVWQMESFGVVDTQHRVWASLFVWMFLVAEFVLLFVFVERRRHFVNQNWMLVFFIVAGVGYIIVYHHTHFRVLQNLQPLMALWMMVPSGRMLWNFFADGKLGTTLIASMIIVILFGLLVSGIDPGINSPWNGVWWALATVSTVGYGDVVPVSALGRMFGAVLIVMGLGMFVIITANFLAIFLKREREGVHESEEDIKHLLDKIEKIDQRQQELQASLKSIERQLKEPK